jgi:hypothetical protein
MFGPSCLRGSSQNLAPLVRADIPPTSGPETHGGAPNWWRRELSAGNIKQFDGEVHQDFRRQARETHDGAQACAPPDADGTRKVSVQRNG